MPNALTTIANVLADVKVAISVAEAAGINVPPALNTYQIEATAALEAVQGFETPANLDALVTDTQKAAAAISILDPNLNLKSIVVALTGTRAFAKDLSSGQLAVIGNMDAHFDSDGNLLLSGYTNNETETRIIVACYREDGAFAKIVDSGTTDTAVTGA